MAKSIAFSSTILSETLRQHNHKVKHMAQASNAKMVVVKKYSGDTLRKPDSAVRH
jgi:ribosomal protein S12